MQLVKLMTKYMQDITHAANCAASLEALELRGTFFLDERCSFMYRI